MIPEQSYYLCIKKENSVAVLVLFMTSNISNFNLQKAFNLKMNSAYEKDSTHEMHSKINQPAKNIEHVKIFNLKKCN